MKKLIIILFIFMLIQTVLADTQVDETTVLSTLGGDFNYTFSEQMNFTNVGTYSDRVMLNYTNISIVPLSGTGNATIYQVQESLIKFIVCCDNVNMCFENLTEGADVYIVEDNEWFSEIGTANVTFNATGCKEVRIRNAHLAMYPQATVLFKELENGENTINIIYSSNLPLIGGALAGAGGIGYVLLRRRRRR